MKSLKDYIFEQMNINEAEESSTTKKFSFSFKDLPNAKETLKSLVDISVEKGIDYESSEDIFEITLNSEDCKNNREKIDSIQDILQQYSSEIRKDSKNASSESFAQLTRKFMNNVNDMVSFIDDSENEDEEEKTKKEDE